MLEIDGLDVCISSGDVGIVVSEKGVGWGGVVQLQLQLS